MTRPSLAGNASPEAFAMAMILCRGYSPSCSSAEECLHEGECFQPNLVGLLGYEGAVAAIDKAASAAKDERVTQWLLAARSSIEHMAAVMHGPVSEGAVPATGEKSDG